MKRIGILTGNPDGVFQSTVIQGIQQVLQTQQHQTIIISDISHPIALDLPNLDGLVVIANLVPDETLHTLAQMGKPLVLVSHQVADGSIPAVIPDNRVGMAQVVDYLVLQCQCRNIALIQGDLSQNDGKERTRVFRDQLLRHDLAMPAHFFLRGDFDVAVAQTALREFLPRHAQEIDALVVADYLMATAALPILREFGLAIPQQISVVGFGDGIEAQEAGLTTVSVNVLELGQRAGKQLLGELQGLKIRGVTLIHTEIIPRHTSRLVETQGNPL